MGDPAPAKRMLQLRNLRPRALDPLDLEVASGECVAIQGPSGSGKTMLLRAIADLDRRSGEVLLDGVACSTIPGPEWRRRVTYLPADSGWWHGHVGPHFHDWRGLARQLDALGMPFACGDWPVERLSTGERQRLALLRAIEGQPRVLLLDEPTAGLDARAVEGVEALLEGLRRDGVTLLWVTHDTAQAGRVAGRRLTLEQGRAVPA